MAKLPARKKDVDAVTTSNVGVIERAPCLAAEVIVVGITTDAAVSR